MAYDHEAVTDQLVLVEAENERLQGEVETYQNASSYWLRDMRDLFAENAKLREALGYMRDYAKQGHSVLPRGHHCSGVLYLRVLAGSHSGYCVGVDNALALIDDGSTTSGASTNDSPRDSTD